MESWLDIRLLHPNPQVAKFRRAETARHTPMARRLQLSCQCDLTTQRLKRLMDSLAPYALRTDRVCWCLPIMCKMAGDAAGASHQESQSAERISQSCALQSYFELWE